MFAFLDTPFDPDHPVYTRANAGEILPDPICPLAWSLAGPSFEEGFRIAFCDSFGLLPRPGPDQPYLTVGRMAARLHLNLSVIRTTAQRLPGTSADVVDVQYFGDAAAGGLPHHEPSAEDRKYRLKAPPQMGRTMAGIGRRVDRDRARVDELTAEVSAALLPDAGTSDAELVRLLRRAAAQLGTVLGTHVTARGLTSPLLEQAVGALTRSGIPEEESLRYVAEIPDLESAKPSRELAEIARAVPAGSPLAEVVASGSMQALADSDVAGAGDLHRRLTAFVADFGHRGVGEFDPTKPAWQQRPDDVVRLLSRLGDQPLTPLDPPDVDPGRIARPLVAAARSSMHRAERTKDTCMRTTNLLRRLLLELRARLADRIVDTHWEQYTVDEVEAVVHGGGGPVAEELARRADSYAEAVAVTPAEWSNGTLRLVEDASVGERATDDDAPLGRGLTGIGGSSGSSKGRVRVLADPYGDFEDGEILVAHITDTAWTPLFLAAGAVVTDLGGVLSHATIVARDLGIPAVVNTKVATAVLRTGDLVEVDGATGTVTVLERP